MQRSPSDAPGSLQQVRTLLNSFHVPHGPRVPVDELAAWCADAAAWTRRTPDIPVPGAGERDELRTLRDDLRAGLGRPAPETLDGWLAAYPVVVGVDIDGAIEYRGDGGAVSGVLTIVVDAVAGGRWARLKGCPDCRHVFYDHSRNRSRTWCAMYAGSADGRACGSIAKVRTYRQRQASAEG